MHILVRQTLCKSLKSVTNMPDTPTQHDAIHEMYSIGYTDHGVIQLPIKNAPMYKVKKGTNLEQCGQHTDAHFARNRLPTLGL